MSLTCSSAEMRGLESGLDSPELSDLQPPMTSERARMAKRFMWKGKHVWSEIATTVAVWFLLF